MAESSKVTTVQIMQSKASRIKKLFPFLFDWIKQLKLQMLDVY